MDATSTLEEHATDVKHKEKSAEKYKEGRLAKAIEKHSAKLPSDTFLWAAAGSIIGSLALNIAGRKHDSLFVGQWAPTFLLLGIYNKIVKVSGSDRTEHGPM